MSGKRPRPLRITGFQNGIIVWTPQEYIDDVGPDLAARKALKDARDFFQEQAKGGEGR